MEPSWEQRKRKIWIWSDSFICLFEIQLDFRICKIESIKYNVWLDANHIYNKSKNISGFK